MADVRSHAGVPVAAQFGGSGAPTMCAPVVVDTATGYIYTLKTGDVVVLAGAGGAGSGDMLKSENLSGLANYTTARSNMGLGALATLSAVVTNANLTGPVTSVGNATTLAVATAAGVYTPTLTEVANLDAATSVAYECQYLRVGASVTVSGKVDINPTAPAASTQLGIELPVASNIGAIEDCCGTAAASGIAGQVAAIIGDVANNRAQMQWVSTDLTLQPMYFQFTYAVI